MITFLLIVAAICSGFLFIGILTASKNFTTELTITALILTGIPFAVILGVLVGAI